MKAEIKTASFRRPRMQNHSRLYVSHWLGVILAAILELGSHLSTGRSATFQLSDGTYYKHTSCTPATRAHTHTVNIHEGPWKLLKKTKPDVDEVVNHLPSQLYHFLSLLREADHCAIQRV